MGVQYKVGEKERVSITTVSITTIAQTMMRLFRPLILCMLVLGCTTAASPEFGEIDWYLSNGTSSDMTLVVYDKICGRSYFRIKLQNSRQVSVKTCMDSAGRSAIRYRRAGMVDEGNPWHDTLMTAGQVLVVR